MRQFDIYLNSDPDSQKAYPFFLDVQTELIDMLNSRVVIPLTTARPTQQLPNNLCPRFEINGEYYYLLTHQITTVSRAFLKEKEGSLRLSRTEIIDALDFLVSGI